MTPTQAMIAKLAAAGIVCGPVGYVSRPAIDRTVKHWTAPKRNHAPTKPHKPKVDRIDTRTVPACPVQVFPFSRIADIPPQDTMMDSDTDEGAMPENGRGSTVTRSFGGSPFAPIVGGGGFVVGPPGPGRPDVPLEPQQPVAPVPEPETWIMAIVGFFAIGFVLRRVYRA